MDFLELWEIMKSRRGRKIFPLVLGLLLLVISFFYCWMLSKS